MTYMLNTDFRQRVVINTATMAWQASPSAGVWRKRLELAGGIESGRVTSLVRYDPGSTFSTHEHPDGEEIFVLDGTFSDEFGDYAAGSYLLNPTGFRHAPFSRTGCTIFVKLRQYAGTDRLQLAIDTATIAWMPGSVPGVGYKLLYAQAGYADQVQLQRWQPGTMGDRHEHLEGEEIFVLAGNLSDEAGHYPTGTWIRNPSQSSHAPFSETGCLLYVKTGGMPKGKGKDEG
jgi:anti-sigma factor ChrR (cupin superfamily)